MNRGPGDAEEDSGWLLLEEAPGRPPGRSWSSGEEEEAGRQFTMSANLQGQASHVTSRTTTRNGSPLCVALSVPSAHTQQGQGQNGWRASRAAQGRPLWESPWLWVGATYSPRCGAPVGDRDVARSHSPVTAVSWRPVCVLQGFLGLLRALSPEHTAAQGLCPPGPPRDGWPTEPFTEQRSVRGLKPLLHMACLESAPKSSLDAGQTADGQSSPRPQALSLPEAQP